MITVSGSARLRVNYSVVLDMTEDEWDALTESKQNTILEDRIDWMDACRSAELDDIDVWDLEEKETE